MSHQYAWKFLSASVTLSLFLLVTSNERLGDDRALVDKYCPITQQIDFIASSPNPHSKFYVYDQLNRSKQAFYDSVDYFIGTSPRATRDAEKQIGEFYTEIDIWCELLKHPQRTNILEEASLFIVPMLPNLARQDVVIYLDEVKSQPAWLKNKGRDHMVMCTHWACINRLSHLLEDLVLPGYLGALERNYKWLDARLHHIDDSPWWPRVNATALSAHDHTLCPERIIILPYPAHHGLASCRRNHRSKLPIPAVTSNEKKNLLVFYAGTKRTKDCGKADDGKFKTIDMSGGVRGAVSVDMLKLRYVNSSTSSPHNTFHSTSELFDELTAKRGYETITLESRKGGGARIGDIGKRTYVNKIMSSYFCLHLRGDTPTSRRFYDAVAGGCLPIVISDKFGAALPFLLNNQVNYSAWVTIIPQSKFVEDPLKELDAVVNKYFTKLNQNKGMEFSNLLPSSELVDMQQAMARDRNKLVICSGSGEVGNQVVQEVFTRLALRKKEKRIHLTSTSTDIEEGCRAKNSEKQLDLYATAAQGGYYPWLTKFYEKYGTDWTWCTETETTFEDYGEKKEIRDRRGNSLRLDVLTHIA